MERERVGEREIEGGERERDRHMEGGKVGRKGVRER